MTSLVRTLEKFSDAQLDFRIFFVMRLLVSFVLVNKLINEIPYIKYDGLSSGVIFTVLFFALIGFSLGIFQKVSALYIGGLLLSSFFMETPLDVKPYQYYFNQTLAFSTLAFVFIHGERTSLFDLLNHRNSRTVHGAGIRLIQIFVIFAYASACLNKCNFGYLQGTHLQQIFMKSVWGSFDMPWRYSGFVFQVLAIASVVIEALLALLLPVKKMSNKMIVVSFVLHTLVYFFLPIYSFSVLMVALVISFGQMSFHRST